MGSISLVLADFGDFGGFALAMLGVAAFIGIGVWFGMHQAKRANESWSQVGRRLGLQFKEGSFFKRPELHGSVQSFPVIVDTFTRGSGKNKTTYSRVKVRFEHLRLGLKLRREGFLSAVTKMFGFEEDIQVGDPLFDSEVMVQGNNVNRLREFLTASRRMRIRRFFNNFPEAAIADDLISCSVRGVVTNPEQLHQMITASISIAWHLSGSRAADANLDQALRAQDEGHAEEALRLVQQNTRRRSSAPPVVAELVEEEPIEAELIEERLLEGELLNLAGRREEAQRVFLEARQAAPYDEEIAEWVEQPDEGPKSDVAEAMPIAQAEDIAPIAVSAAQMCDQLFASGSTSYQINQHFDKHHAGAAVEWTGKLKRVESFTYDLVFGNEPACRAVIVIHQLENAIYGDRTVSAIVRFPADAYDDLNSKTSEEITFRGKLHKVDSLLRNVYLTEGDLAG